MFTKTLLAVALFAAVGSAQASGITNGDVLLSVIDTTNLSSYSLDLGITAAALEANPSLIRSVSDANFSAFVAGIAAGDNVTYNLQSTYAWKANYPDFLSTFTTTSSSDLAALAPNTTAGVTALGSVGTSITTIFTAVNAAASASSVLVQNGATGYVGAYGANNTNAEGALTNQIAVGSSLELWEARRSAAKANAFTDLGSVNFSIAGNTGTLVIGNTTPAAVPLPTSVWMFLSGIVGLVSMKRRKNAAI